MKDVVLYGLIVAVVIASVTLYNKLEQIDTSIKSVEIQSIVSSGRAIYMPGNVCILKATSDISPEKMREFADACIKSHEDWLEIGNEDAIYNDGDTDSEF